MCNPTLVIAGISAGLQYQQSVAQQKAMRDAQLRQNEIAKKNLENKRAKLQADLIQKSKKNLKILSIKEKEARRKKSQFLASERGFTGNTYSYLVGNFEDSLGNVRNSVLGNIQFDANQFRNNYLGLNDVYNSQTTFVTNVDRGTSALSAGLNYASAYYDYKNKQGVAGTDVKEYSYDEIINDEYNLS